MVEPRTYENPSSLGGDVRRLIEMRDHSLLFVKNNDHYMGHHIMSLCARLR
jgi:hypothetical protein